MLHTGGSAQKGEAVRGAWPRSTATGRPPQKQPQPRPTDRRRLTPGAPSTSPTRKGWLRSPGAFRAAELQEFSRRCRFVNDMLTFFNWKLLGTCQGGEALSPVTLLRAVRTPCFRRRMLPCAAFQLLVLDTHAKY